MSESSSSSGKEFAVESKAQDEQARESAGWLRWWRGEGATDTSATVLLVLLGGVLALAFVSALVSQWAFLYDDAFITYQYAKNLAMGHGIVWHPSQAPTEGYTNFLLVLLLAPAIKMGLDPFLVTRLLSLASLFAIAGLLVAIAVRFFAMEKRAAFVLALAFVCTAQATSIVLLGMETLLFALAMFASLYGALVFFEKPSYRTIVLVGGLQFLSFLLRPEAVLFAGSFGVIVLLQRGRLSPSLWKLLLAFAASLAAPAGLYLLWKQLYFGGILPNSFYIKANNAGWYHPLGLQSILHYVASVRGLVVLILFALVWRTRDTENEAVASGRWVVLLFLGLFLAFYARVETVQDNFSRFLYPLTPFLFFLALPFLQRMTAKLLHGSASWGAKFVAGVGILFAVFFYSPTNTMTHIKWALEGYDRYSNPRNLMRMEYLISLRLARFPDIRNVSIAFGDAGVLAYYTNAYFIDTVGLNDRFIATQKDRKVLLRYLFETKKPTIFILPTFRGGRLLRRGHGPLGNWAEWVRHPLCRWKDYVYVGSTATSYYALTFLVRKDYAQSSQLRAFLKKHIVEIKHPRLPIPVSWDTD